MGIIKRTMMIQADSLSGKKFGFLTLVKRDESHTGRHPKWHMLCDCGTEKSIDLNAVKSGRQVACGCFRLRRVAETRRLDLDGKRIGMLVVRNFYASLDGETFWMCQCDCGCGYIGRGNHLSRGRVQSCGHEKRLMAEKSREDIQGHRFGALVAVELVEKRTAGNPALAHWLSVCDCGNTVTVPSRSLKAGRVVSCGCRPAKKGAPMRPASIRSQSVVLSNRRRARIVNAGGIFTAEQIETLRLKQRGRCANCQVKLTDKNMERDHRQALARGGSNDILNMELLCRPCNGRKGAKDEIDWANKNGRLL